MIKYFGFIIAISFLLIACGEKNEQPEAEKIDSTAYVYDQSDLKTEGVDNTTKSFKLSYNFNKGDKARYRLTTISENVQTVSAETTITMKLHQEVIYLVDFEINSVEDDGTTEAELKINALKLMADVNGEKFTFEAGKEKDSSQIKRFAEFYSLWNNPFSIRFSKSGEILEIFRVDKISNKFFKLKDADTVNIQTKNLIKDDMVANVLKPLTIQIIRSLPDKEVAKDSTWSVRQNPITMMAFQILFTNKYKLDEVELLDDEKLAVIEAGMDYTATGNTNFTEQGVNYKFNKPIAKGEGKIYFNLDKGIVQKSRTLSSTEFFFTMEMDTPVGKQKGSRKEILSNTNVVELISFN